MRLIADSFLCFLMDPGFRQLPIICGKELTIMYPLDILYLTNRQAQRRDKEMNNICSVTSLLENPLPQPGDVASYKEYYAEVVECDGRSVWLDVMGYDEEFQVQVPYIVSDWT